MNPPRFALLIACVCACADDALIERLEVELVVEPDLVDFGDVPAPGSGVEPVLLTNRGAVVLRLSGTELLGELAHELTVEELPSVLAPNQTAMVHVVFRPLVPADRREGTIAFLSDSAKSPRVSITVRGRALKPALEAVPPELDFGAVVAGDTRTMEVTLVNTVEHPVTVLDASASDETFSAPVTEAWVMAPRSIAPFVVRYSPLSLGSNAGSVAIHDDTARAQPLMISVRGLGVPSEIELLPSALDFRGIVAGESRTLFFVIMNHGRRAHTVSSLELESTGALAGSHHFDLTEGSAGTVPFTIEPGSARQIDVVYRPDRAGSDADVVRVTSTGIAVPGHARVTLLGTTGDVPVSDIHVSPSALDFGEGTVGAETPRELMVTNAGEAELVFTMAPAIDPESSPYQIVNVPPATLRPGEARMMYVVFTPLASGPAPLAELVFHSNDPDENPLRIPLTASAR